MKPQAPASHFTFSDTIAGYVTASDADSGRFTLRTSDGREFAARLTEAAFARAAHNLEEDYQDCTGHMRDLLAPGQFVHAYGIFYPEGDGMLYEVKSLVFPSTEAGKYGHEEPDWWVRQIRSIADSYIRWQFGYPEQEMDYRNYRTFLHLGGAKKGDFLQETDTISRMVYGMASAFLLTGEDRFLEAAEKGTEYLRAHMRFHDADEDIVYWYHGIVVSGDRERKLLTSEFGEDYDSIPAYEQIYALAGPTQTYRITGDPRIRWDIDKTLELFERHYRDPELGGYFSHIDPIGFDPRAETLEKGNNRAKKNWNSVGDHAPAYLINLFLATGDPAHRAFLVETADTITRHFQDYEHSPFVQEKFYEDWRHDTTWGWQRNRAVVGHNLKIAWNLMRVYHIEPKPEYLTFARKIAEIMPTVGWDRQRGGWYDVMERALEPGQTHHRLVWHDRKAWWQQEQGILAYMILHGSLGDAEYLRYARESAAFYNAFFLDHDDGAVYFNTLANGLPYLLGTERLKGSHSMSAYHSTELCYLAAVYTNLLTTNTPMDFHFRPKPGGFPDGILRVAPDLLPPGRVRLTAVEMDGAPHEDFDAEAMLVRLPASDHDLRVRVTLTPTARQ